MSKKLSASFIELTQDALLKAFWYKPTFRLFLAQHGISEKALAQWHADQTKRDFISWLWPQLLKSDKGDAVILSMARDLAEMQHFPDLERKEDTKTLVPKAREAVARLQHQVLKVNETIHESGSPNVGEGPRKMR